MRIEPDDFHIVFTEDSVDGGYVITVSEIPEIITEADSIEEGMKMAKDAISTYMSHQKEHKKITIKILPKSEIITASPV